MAFRRLTITLRRLMATAPLAKLELTIMGSISGVSPTATASAKSEASSQSPLVNPLMKSTTGAMTSMKRISTQLTLLTPRSKAVMARVPMIDLASEPNQVLFPVATTTADAWPLTTLVPMRQMFFRSSRSALASAFGSVFRVVSRSASGAASPFSTGSASPLRID